MIFPGFVVVVTNIVQTHLITKENNNDERNSHTADHYDLEH
jgi:hypothetical protein